MPSQDLLIEIGTEELPPNALSNLSRSFEELLCESLKKLDLSFRSVKRFSTPRRLGVLVISLQENQENKEVKKFGPAISAAFDEKNRPTLAAHGFAKSCGVDVDDLAVVERDGVEKLCHSIHSQGQATKDLLPDIVRQALLQLPVPKRMRWGSSREEFVRPVHWLVLLFGNQIIDLEIYGVKSNRITIGHRFHHNKELIIDNPNDYEECLEKSGHVIPDFAKRKSLIRDLIIDEGKKLQAITIVDNDLLEEVTALVEFPVALTGNFDDEFLKVPPEALILAMKSHQKCFHLVDQNSQLLPKFVAVSNIISRNPAEVVRGNERVIRPRLADARFFFKTDKQITLASRIDQLKKIVFHEKLGTIFDKSERVAGLCKSISQELGADTANSVRAAYLAKCDLLTRMVGEFADLQGLMGSYYAEHDSEPGEVSAALREQYLPGFAGDQLPESLVGSVLAVSDKLDTIVSLFGINQPPTGSKDPFGLRRSAIGILRILIENELDLDILKTIDFSVRAYKNIELEPNTTAHVFEFFLDRFRSLYQEAGISSTVFESVFVLKPTRPLDFHHRVQAVQSFTKLTEAQALASANKRVSNLLSKQQPTDSLPKCKISLLREPAEHELYQAIQSKKVEVAPLIEKGDYTMCLRSLSTLKTSVDAFFDSVLVIHEDDMIRINRLALLHQLRDLFLKTADISYLHSN